MTPPLGTGRRSRPLTWFALAAAAVGLALVLVAVLTRHDPAPDLDGPVGTLPDASSSQAPKAAVPDVEPAKQVPLGPSEPIEIEIPAIGVESDVFAIGKTADGALAVPQPGPNLDKAAWFENSPTPGQPGPAIIEGHVATEESGPSIFYDLADLRPGDDVRVARQDGTVAVFTVDALREFDKSAFPTQLVYGGDLSQPTLRLITCSGFDPSVGRHTGNLVVFASLDRVQGRTQ
ncbi:sortase [Nocardioides sp.]|uniref:sortase domain-containing protein n=1 Tax=Nocardioides sp. TaxID=35761 RepID=UPI00273750CD|nr:sortase [Nocardioides sp.]MDP3892660.1 sortase [Nocardioides sp.]